MKQTATIFGKLHTLNEYINAERSNRYKAAEIKRLDTQYCFVHVKDLQPITEPVDITFNWFPESNKHDPDNIAFGSKFILDALVKAGILQGDGRKHIKSLHHTFTTDSVHPRCEVVLEY